MCAYGQCDRVENIHFEGKMSVAKSEITGSKIWALPISIFVTEAICPFKSPNQGVSNGPNNQPAVLL